MLVAEPKKPVGGGGAERGRFLISTATGTLWALSGVASLGARRSEYATDFFTNQRRALVKLARGDLSSRYVSIRCELNLVFGWAQSQTRQSENGQTRSRGAQLESKMSSF